VAGRVGRPHGLDGSFHVADPDPELLVRGAVVEAAGERRAIERLAGTPEKPIVRLEGCERREDAEALRGQALTVPVEQAPALAPGEFWAHEIAGCAVTDGERAIGFVRRMVALPSCEALEVDRPDGGELLIPLVRDAVRSLDIPGRRVDVDLEFLGEA
jgi:16S rRNA processing protein RimM